MSLPKEPRQKMINMMYLVLTAMLALNVSSEILNAFRTVNTSIATSNAVITAKNNVTYESFAEKLKDPQTQAKAAIWAPKAAEVKKASADLFAYIETLKEDMKKASDLRMKDGREEFKEDNLDAPTRLMDKEGNGKKLYDKLVAYKQQIIGVLKPEEFAGNAAVQAQLKKDIDALQKSIPIDMSVPKGRSGKDYSNDAQGWTTSYFHMTPTIAALTILSKFQNDVKNSESQLVDYCHQQIGQVKVVFDQFQAIAQANTNYAMPNDPIEITAGVGAFSAAAKPRIYVGGQLLPLTTEGTAVYKTTASGAGEHVVDVKIEYAKPDGSIATVNKKVNYTVGMPAGVAVSANKMNVLYIGVDNPLTITAGVGSEKINATFSGGQLTKQNGSQWIAKPKTPGEHNINVIVDGKSTPVKFRVKFLPDPAAFVGAKRGGAVSAADFKVQGGLIARLTDSDFEAPFRVVSYQVGAIGGKFPVYQFATNNGNRWEGDAKRIVEGAGPGTTVFFDQIKVVGPDGRPRDLPQMSFNLK